MTTTPQGDQSVLDALFAHNTWANLRLLDFCAQLDDAQLDATVVGGFGSIRDTLRHIIGGEVSYVTRVTGARPATPLGPDFPGFAALNEAARWTGEELLKLARAARADTLVREPPTNTRCQYPLASLMVQAITHATEHRAQVATILSQLGLEPPDMSTWEYMVVTGEFQEFAEE